MGAAAVASSRSSALRIASSAGLPSLSIARVERGDLGGRGSAATIVTRLSISAALLEVTASRSGNGPAQEIRPARTRPRRTSPPTSSGIWKGSPPGRRRDEGRRRDGGRWSGRGPDAPAAGSSKDARILHRRLGPGDRPVAAPYRRPATRCRRRRCAARPDCAATGAALRGTSRRGGGGRRSRGACAKAMSRIARRRA